MVIWTPSISWNVELFIFLQDSDVTAQENCTNWICVTPLMRIMEFWRKNSTQDGSSIRHSILKKPRNYSKIFTISTLVRVLLTLSMKFGLNPPSCCRLNSSCSLWRSISSSRRLCSSSCLGYFSKITWIKTHDLFRLITSLRS